MVNTVKRQPFKLTPSAQPRNRQAQGPEDAGHAHVREETEAEAFQRRARGEKLAEVADYRAIDNLFHHQPNRLAQALHRMEQEGESSSWAVGGPTTTRSSLSGRFAEPSVARAEPESSGARERAFIGQASAELSGRERSAETARAFWSSEPVGASFAAWEDLQGPETRRRTHTGQSMRLEEGDIQLAAEFSSPDQAAEGDHKKHLLIQQLQHDLQTVAQANLCLQSAYQEVLTALSGIIKLRDGLTPSGHHEVGEVYEHDFEPE